LGSFLGRQGYRSGDSISSIPVDETRRKATAWLAVT
jgi:hypothetical protein